jgi:hypothetical protein
MDAMLSLLAFAVTVHAKVAFVIILQRRKTWHIKMCQVEVRTLIKTEGCI